MCSVDWNLFADMLSGIGTLLVGIAAILTLFIQYGYRTKSKHLETSLKLLLNSYRGYMASEEGIVWADYPADSQQIVAGIANKTGLNTKLVKELLDSLKAEGKI